MVRVGDCFCGGGAIPYESVRIGCETYGSDLNPVAGLLTWSSINFGKLSSYEQNKLVSFQHDVFRLACEKYAEYEVEEYSGEIKDTAYLYCVEAQCPECGKIIPLIPTNPIHRKV